MKRKPLIIIATVVGVLVLIIILLPFLVDVNHFRPMITSQMQQALGRPVQIGDLRLSILAGGVSAQNISIGVYWIPALAPKRRSAGMTPQQSCMRGFYFVWSGFVLAKRFASF